MYMQGSILSLQEGKYCFCLPHYSQFLALLPCLSSSNGPHYDIWIRAHDIYAKNKLQYII